eukprot:360078-Chlamydomonas_euryale.AAC.14
MLPPRQYSAKLGLPGPMRIAPTAWPSVSASTLCMLLIPVREALRKCTARTPHGVCRLAHAGFAAGMLSWFVAAAVCCTAARRARTASARVIRYNVCVLAAGVDSLEGTRTTSVAVAVTSAAR